MTQEQLILMQAMGHLDDRHLQAAHAPGKRLRRFLPTLITVCVVVLILSVYPHLREVINTDSDLLNGPPSDGAAVNGSGGTVDQPGIAKIGETVTLGGTSLTLTDLTDTTAQLTVIKTDSQPLYAAVYDLKDRALACTEPDYKVDGAIIRGNTLSLTVNGETGEVFAFPSAPGTYTVTVDFSRILNGPYPMADYMGFYAYIGKDNGAVRQRIATALPESDSILESATVESEPSESTPAETSTGS